MWAPQLAAMAGGFAPSIPVDHQHIALAAVPGHELPREMPCFRDTDNLVYGKAEAGGILFGGYEPNPAARWADGVPWDHAGRTVPANEERFAQLMDGAVRRFPFLDGAGVVALICHPDAMTPDGNPLLGPMPGVPGFWMAAGLSLNGFGGAGGIGKAIAEWMTTGDTELDVSGYRAWRFGRVYRDTVYATEAAREAYKYYYRLRYPLDVDEWGRPKRVSPLHGRLQELGAVFGVKNGWERADYFVPGQSSRRAGADQRRFGWSKPPYLERLAEEHVAFRERVGIIDMTSFGKIEVTGPGALGLLERVADNRIDRPVGSLVYTQFLNAHGGIVADVTVTRLGEEHFRVVTGAGTVDSDLGWLRLSMRRRGRSGRAARSLGGALGHRHLGPARTRRPPVIDGGRCFRGGASFPSRPEDPSRRRGGPRPADHLRGRARVRALCGARVGRPALGPPPRGRGTARNHAGRLPGARFAQDGEGLPLSRDRPDRLRHPVRGGPRFLRGARQGRVQGPRGARGEAPPDRRLRTLLVGEEEYLPVYGGEAVHMGGGVAGRVRSAAYGFTVGRNVAFAYLPSEVREGDEAQVEIFGDLVAATVAANVLYDPSNERILA